MSSVAPTKSPDWWKWYAADVQRKAGATRSSDHKILQNKDAAANLLAG
ncbi:predicted protein [Sclerotinia sclerotiorum 1980 UF-70]|uniref:Uncharacterized protein n=1 Tax=Sclerotinia sclerotiorum (strain ATCC 18683 / 1980 / Ss-1) TaxID=665079 RepID=A7EEJ9_SCLS1|nr:predicted protein [Sclerotinia sclerotiorum 1980 UF-70]EDO01265.1 predicted protein [Sclerotinia sclerotiorum 1980 UF-70]